jgi:hypothetical protein
MNVLTFETRWAVNSETIKQVISNWSIFIKRVCILTLVIRHAKRIFSKSYYSRTRLYRHEMDIIFCIVVNGFCSNGMGYVMVNSEELIGVPQKIWLHRRVAYTDVVITGLNCILSPVACVTLPSHPHYRGADKSLARSGRKQSRKHVRDARDFNRMETQAVIKFFLPPVRQGAEGNSRHSHRNISLFPLLVGLRTYQHPCIS